MEQKEKDFFYRKLGRTDLVTSCLGIGGGGGIKSEDVLYAFAEGINFFFYSSDLHHFLYRQMNSAIYQLCGRQSSVRDKVVLATVTYLKKPQTIEACLFDQFAELGIDYIDIFFWGWIDSFEHEIFTECMNASSKLRGPNSVYQRYVETMFGTSERLKKMGAVRYVGASFHDHKLAAQWLDSPLLDVVMVRHNIAHRSAQNLVFPHLNPEDPTRPGVVTFKSVGMAQDLRIPPTGLPDFCWRPSVPDLYRYSLSQNSVDVCLMGVTKKEEIEAAIAGVKQGKLQPEEIEYLNLYGQLQRSKLNLEGNIPPELIQAQFQLNLLHKN